MKPTFGDEKQIRLVQLESQYAGIKPLDTVDHDCDCPYCDEVNTYCPYCDEIVDEDECLRIEKCTECNKKIMPSSIASEIFKIKYELKLI